MIKVLIVDDSLTVREKIAQIIAHASGMEVAGKAGNGKEAVKMAMEISPDVIIMDLVMPVMDGLEATGLIMAYAPVPIIIHSSAVNRQEGYKTMDALAAGALDFMEKNGVKWENELVERVKKISGIKVVTHIKKRVEQGRERKTAFCENMQRKAYNLLVVGASTGGPKAVQDIFSKIPADFPLPVLLVIHVVESYQSTFVDWLNSNISLKVKIAENGESVTGRKGVVFMAPSGRHLTVKNMAFCLSQDPPVNFCRPSVDVLFKSVAMDPLIKPVGVLLTGMGKDGAAGLNAIKKSGGYTIVQDKSTSMVFGMPGAAIEMGGASVVLPDFRISDEIIRLAGL